MSDAKHTQFAMKALGLADMFRQSIGEHPVGASVKYRVELAAPEGTSTGGGTQAVQPIKLIPIQGGATLVAGTANQVEGKAELRSYNYLTWLQAQRFQSGALPLPREAYDVLLVKLKNFFAAQGLQVGVTEPPEGGQAPAPAAGGDKGVLIGVVAALVILGGILAFLFLRH